MRCLDIGLKKTKISGYYKSINMPLTEYRFKTVEYVKLFADKKIKNLQGTLQLLIQM